MKSFTIYVRAYIYLSSAYITYYNNTHVHFKVYKALVEQTRALACYIQHTTYYIGRYGRYRNSSLGHGDGFVVTVRAFTKRNLVSKSYFSRKFSLFPRKFSSTPSHFVLPQTFKQRIYS